MIIAHVADIHISARDPNMSLEEQADLLRWIGRDAAEHEAQAILVAGDVFDGTSTPAERNVLLDVMTGWANERPVLIVGGNHDRPDDLHFLTRLRTAHSIHVYEHPAVTQIAGLVVACLPWPRKANLVRELGTDSQLSTHEAAGQALRMILQGFSAAFEHELRPCILLGHVELGGASMDSGQPVSPSADFSLVPADLTETGADYIALGHIHQHQVINDRICYAGAVRQCAFGEDPVKGYCVVDVIWRGVDIVHRIAPFRELITLEDLGGGEYDVDMQCGNDVRDNAYRIVYRVAEAEREYARLIAEEYRRRLLALGAYRVKIDGSTIPAHRVRSEEIRTAKTTEEKLRAYWASRGEEPPARLEQIFGKLAELEEGVQS